MPWMYPINVINMMPAKSFRLLHKTRNRITFPLLIWCLFLSFNLMPDGYFFCIYLLHWKEWINITTAFNMMPELPLNRYIVSCAASIPAYNSITSSVISQCLNWCLFLLSRHHQTANVLKQYSKLHSVNVMYKNMCWKFWNPVY